MVLPLKGNQWAQRLDPLSPLPHSQPFIIVVVVFLLFNWRIIALSNGLTPAIHQHEWAIGVHTSLPIVPPPTSLVTSLEVQTVKSLPAVQETWVRSLGREDLLEKEMATHSSILAWRIPWTEEPGTLQSMRSQRVGLSDFTFTSHLPPSPTPTASSLVIISCHPTRQTPCWLAVRWITQLQADGVRPAPSCPCQGQPRSTPGCRHLGFPRGSSWFLSPPSSFGVLSLWLISLVPEPWPWSSVSLTWGLFSSSSSSCLHRAPGDPLLRPEASWNTSLPSDLPPRLSQTHRGSQSARAWQQTSATEHGRRKESLWRDFPCPFSSPTSGTEK